MAKKVKLPSDTNKRAKAIVDLVTEQPKPTVSDEIRAAAAALGRKGGLIGGKARAAILTDKERSDIARKAAKARWHKNE